MNRFGGYDCSGLFLQSANSQRRSLEAEVKVRTAAMESFDQMNSSLISSNIDLQV